MAKQAKQERIAVGSLRVVAVRSGSEVTRTTADGREYTVRPVLAVANAADLKGLKIPTEHIVGKQKKGVAVSVSMPSDAPILAAGEVITLSDARINVGEKRIFVDYDWSSTLIGAIADSF